MVLQWENIFSIYLLVKQSVIIFREVLLILDKVLYVLRLIHTLDQDVLLYPDTIKENKSIYPFKTNFSLTYGHQI